MNITILGTGNVGQALARGWVRAGYQITFGSRQPEGDKAHEMSGSFEKKIQIRATAEAIQDAEVVVLAVPWDAAESVTSSIDDWHGKILVDATNPIAPGFELAVGHNNSGAELIQGWTKGARVVKAFNTTGFNNMLDPTYNGEPTIMLIAGDDASAKKHVAQLAEALGFEVADLGSLSKARLLEPFAMTWIN